MSQLPTELDQLRAKVDELQHRIGSLQRELRAAENFITELANDIVEQAPDCWDGDEAIEHIAVEYVRALEDMSLWSIGRMPMRGDYPRALVYAPLWADRASIQSDEDRGIDGDPDTEVRYDADGRGWHVRPAA